MGPSELGSMLGESDAVVVAAALTPETEGIFDAATFRRMKRGAWFVNVARGKIVRERDLVQAMREGQVGGAALDVFETEPLPAGSPLAGCRHLILTPHIAGVTRESNARVSMLIAEKVAAALGGSGAHP